MLRAITFCDNRKRNANKMKEETTKNDFDLDSILPELGDFGRFQIVVYIISCVIISLTAAVGLSYIFTTGQVDYRCRIPECDNSSSVYKSDWLNFTTPAAKGRPATCTRFVSTLNLSQYYDDNVMIEPICSADNFNQSLVERCTSDFIYRNDELTILNEFNLTCIENEWKLTAVGSVGNIAEMLWLPIAGLLSDRFGRRTILITCLLIGGTMGLLKSFSHNYLMFFILQIFEGTLSTSPYIAVFVLGMEFVGPSKRVMAGTLLSSTYCVGVMLLGAVAMYTEHFRHLLQILYATVLLVLVIIWWMPESVRWLIQMGRNEEAVKIIRNAAVTNKVTLSEETELELERLKFKVTDKTENQINGKSDIQSALRSKTILLRLLNCCYCFFVNDLVYFGLSVHSVALGGNKYTNFILIGLSEIPAVLSSYVLMDKLGRKWSIFLSMMISGGACILTEFLPEDALTWRLVLFIFGKGGISVSITVLYVYCSELFPTNVRQSLLSVGCTFGRLGSMAAPQTPLLAHIWPALPLLIFGGTSLMSGLFILFLPETLNAKLPDTLEDAENVGVTKKYAAVELKSLKI
ncbi:solute carrier family 22 member 4-like isoform X2 [Bradysia coprophila]|uniref:solute carrier family 22 member 4-like isoform X2 n=1 Tax=Bradysia coprophila TaxID=38358 RepID=UPI00187DCE2D|nr:solute carrier family 22 member 4-like isoform X2 [Bradysia coprophila]